MLKGRKKKNHGFRMMEREIKVWKRKMKREGQMKCSTFCAERFKRWPTHNICNSCPWVKTSPFKSKADVYHYFRNKRARLKMYWEGVELGMIDEHCYDYWLGGKSNDVR